MYRKFFLYFILISSIVCQPDKFNIGVYDQQIYDYLQPISVTTAPYVLKNFTIPSDLNSNIDSYKTFTNTLKSMISVIGKFHYGMATICQTNTIPYLIIDEQIDRSSNTGALLDFSFDWRLLAGALNFTLGKYNWLQNLQFISDSSSNAMDILWGFSGQTIKQCNFQANDSDTEISRCYQNLNLVNTPGKAYVFVTSDDNTNLLQKIMMQSLYRSLPYNSFIFLPMMNTSKFLIDFQYSGGILYTFKLSDSDTDTSATILQSNSLAALNLINNSLTYQKINSSTSRLLILKILQNQEPFFKTTGDRAIYSFYWKIQTVSSNFLTMLSVINLVNNYTLQNDISDPTNIAMIDSISVLYYYDQIFAIPVNSPDGGLVPGGFMIEFLNSLLLPIKISFSNTQPINITNIGRLTETGYTGMLGQLNNNGGDMIAFPVPFETSYLDRFSYSQKIFVVPYSILMKQSSKGLNFFRLSEPYTPIVWISIIVVIVFLSVILWLINLISPNIADSTERLTISNSIFMVIGSFLIAKMLVKPNMISTQIFYLLIWLITLLLISAYVANLSVSIVFQKAQTIKFTTIEQLWYEKNIKWTFIQDSYLYNRVMLDIKSNINSTLVFMYNYSWLNWNNSYLITDSTNIPDFLFNNPDFGILNDAYHNMYYSLRNCNLITMNDAGNNLSLAYIMQPGFKYQTQLYQQIITLQTTGTIENLENKYFYTGQCSSINPLISSVQPLDLSDMAGIFILITIGIVAAFPVAVIEYLLNKSKLQCQRKTTGNSLRFGQVYKARVTGLDRNGVIVDIGRLNLFSTNNEGRMYYVPKKYLGVKRKGERESLAPTDQGIMIGTKLLLKYMGNNPVDSKRIFVQVHKK